MTVVRYGPEITVVGVDPEMLTTDQLALRSGTFELPLRWMMSTMCVPCG